MAWTQFRSGSYRILFRHGGKQHAFTIGGVSQAEADAKAAHVDYLLMRLKQGLIELPAGVDIVSFVEQDGHAAPAQKATARRQSATVGSLRDAYLATQEGAQEKKTLYTRELHFKHFARILGDRFSLAELNHAALQQYVNRRSADGVSPTTIRTELRTLRAAWNWGRRAELVSGEWAGQGLVFRKTREKPPFQTRAEIERQIAGGGLTAEQQKELWEALYLQTEEIEEVLHIIRANALHPWIYPMAATAAYTGARRSELMRMRVADVDFAAGVITVREKKRVRGQTTTRRVPLASALAELLRDYVAGRSEGNYLFGHVGTVERSKKRSRTTGHKGMKSRASGGKARLESVRDRGEVPLEPLTEKEAHDHLKRSLAGTSWKVLRGWHVLRHSFISACASRGVDQRLIQTWCGHMSAEMSARYTHLYPSVHAHGARFGVRLSWRCEGRTYDGAPPLEMGKRPGHVHASGRPVDTDC